MLYTTTPPTPHLWLWLRRCCLNINQKAVFWSNTGVSNLLTVPASLGWRSTCNLFSTCHVVNLTSGRKVTVEVGRAENICRLWKKWHKKILPRRTNTSFKSKSYFYKPDYHNIFLTWGQLILLFIQNCRWDWRSLLPFVILKGRTNELTKILIVFNLEVLLTAWDKKKPLCCKSQKEKKKVVKLRRKKVAECQSMNKVALVKAGVEMLSLGQELECWSQSRSWKYPICFSEDPLVQKERWKNNFPDTNGP